MTYEDYKVDKARLKDKMGRPLTQGLFLEIGYNTDFAVYSLEDDDREYKGNLYPSLKRLYLQAEDVVEYEFARKYLLGWKHWQRLNANKVLSNHFQEWREELELSMRSEAVRSIIDLAVEQGNFNASKWLADRGWDKRAPGRPSKDELRKDKAIADRISSEFSEDFERLKLVK